MTSFLHRPLSDLWALVLQWDFKTFRLSERLRKSHLIVVHKDLDHFKVQRLGEKRIKRNSSKCVRMIKAPKLSKHQKLSKLHNCQSTKHCQSTKIVKAPKLSKLQNCQSTKTVKAPKLSMQNRLRVALHWRLSRLGNPTIREKVYSLPSVIWEVFRSVIKIIKPLFQTLYLAVAVKFREKLSKWLKTLRKSFAPFLKQLNLVYSLRN